jgi:hypothetical protein
MTTFIQRAPGEAQLSLAPVRACLVWPSHVPLQSVLGLHPAAARVRKFPWKLFAPGSWGSPVHW